MSINVISKVHSLLLTNDILMIRIPYNVLGVYIIPTECIVSSAL